MSKDNLYRPNVAMVIVSSNYPHSKEIFVAKRNDMKDIWQLPQGGIDSGESVEDALFRELNEEIGTDKLEVIASFPSWLDYKFPKDIAKSMKPYIGQRQKYFLLKLLDDDSVDINTAHPEFSEYKFVSSKDVLELEVGFKKEVYKEVINYFIDEGLL
ncbi:MAG: RNA pyrophosphohydrolase [Sulfurimonas sp.]|nr:RNA pyrophosphohydrolase [Sulfurimonadaceae bacterium]